MIDHKTNLSSFRKIEIMPSIFSDHIGMKFEINNKRKVSEASKVWKLTTFLIKIGQIKNQRKIKNYLQTNEN